MPPTSTTAVTADGHASAREDGSFVPGVTIGRFVVLGLLGRGGMGEVYAAHDPELDRNVAIKLLRVGSAGDSAEGRFRLTREAQAIARVSHPNVVVVYDVGTFKDRVFIAMEFVDGHTLGYWRHAQTRTWPEVLEVFVAAGRGLAAAHERELVHRDFKPDNVMIAADGQVRVMDFGLVQLLTGRSGAAALEATERRPAPAASTGPDSDTSALEAPRDLMATRPVVVSRAGAPGRAAPAADPLGVELTQAGTTLGTPAYMSPEQFGGLPTDARTDQFSFCVALYEALYGERPFMGRNFQELVGQVLNGRIRDEPPGSQVPAWIRDLLLRGLSVDPAARWPSMNALLAELENQPGVASRRRFVQAAAAKFEGIWDLPKGNRSFETPSKTALRRAFLATDKVYAGKACDGVCQILDRYADRWSKLYVETCEATHVRGEQSAEVLDLRMACLQDGLDDLTALCRVLQQATPEVVENAVRAANALGNLERCDDIELLRAVVKPPQDEATREATGRLRAELADVRALGNVGRVNDALAAAASLEQAVRRIQYSPLLTETLVTIGRLQQEKGLVRQAAATYEEALWIGIACRHDEAAVEAAIFLVFIAGCLQSRFEIAEMWGRLAEAVLGRIGGHLLLRGWFLHHRSAVREAEGRVNEALDDIRAALAAKEEALAPDDPDLGYSIGNLAMYLDGLGLFAEAVEQNQRALKIIEGGLGPDHPRCAVILSNDGEFLAHLGRFEEAFAAASRALAIFERETDPEGLYVSYPLLTLGVSSLGLGRIDEALPALERAHKIREAHESAPSKRADARFALARALWHTEAERPRALALAQKAHEEYEQSPAMPATQRELVAVRAWLAARE